jgi:hypothetical protein
MTVKETIEYLQQFPDELLLVVLDQRLGDKLHKAELHPTWSEIVPCFKVAESA